MQLEVHQPPPETATVPRQLRTLPSLCFTSGYLQILGQLFEFGEIIEILQYDAAVVKQRQIVLDLLQRTKTLFFATIPARQISNVVDN
jgi:hypothetical protein